MYERQIAQKQTTYQQLEPAHNIQKKKKRKEKETDTEAISQLSRACYTIQGAFSIDNFFAPRRAYINKLTYISGERNSNIAGLNRRRAAAAAPDGNLDRARALPSGLCRRRRGPPDRIGLYKYIYIYNRVMILKREIFLEPRGHGNERREKFRG